LPRSIFGKHGCQELCGLIVQSPVCTGLEFWAGLGRPNKDLQVVALFPDVPGAQLPATSGGYSIRNNNLVLKGMGILEIWKDSRVPAAPPWHIFVISMHLADFNFLFVKL
jgi:hypothetical protein